MTEQTQEPTTATTVPSPGESSTTAVPVTNLPAAQPAPAPLPSPPAPATQPGQYAPNGKTWESKYHGAVGRLKQVEAARDETMGAHQQQSDDLEQQLRQANAKVATLEEQVRALTDQAGTIPQLQGELNATRQQAARAGRLEVLMHHPDLLAVQVEEKQTVGDQEQTVMINPFMEFIDTTTLEGDPLDAMLRQMAVAMGQAPGAAPAPSPVVEGAAPQPAQPAPTNDLDSLRAEAMKWHELSITGQPGPNGEDSHEMESEAWENFYAAQAVAAS